MIKFLKRLGILLLCLIICGALALGYAFKIEPFLTVTKTHELGREGGTGQLTVVQLSDIQVSDNYPEEHLEKLVQKVNRLNPDVILFSGDLFDNYSQYQPADRVGESLKAMTAKYGKFAVWGNRDYGGGASRIYRQVMENGGFTLLENDAALLTLDSGKRLLVGGLDDALLGRPDTAKLEQAMNADADYKIMMLHEPDTVDQFTAPTADLILSGHSHGGQVRLPFFDGMRTSLALNYTRGFYDTAAGQLYVNSGIGTSRLPVRFMVPPEIGVFKITL